MCFDDAIKMTVREGPDPEYHEPFKMTKLNPYLSSDYSKYLIQIGGDSYMQACDMMVGVHNLAETIAMMKKALDKKNGIKVQESKDMYHNQLDF